MIHTFSFRTETAHKNYQHTIYAADIKTAIDYWIQRIEELAQYNYSYSPTLVANIKRQYSNGTFQVHVDKAPWFLVFQLDGKPQIAHIDKVDRGQPDFIASITYLPTEQGGRTDYVVSGYRPRIRFDGRKELTSSEQLFINQYKVFPGETVKAEIRILGTDFFKNYLFVGQHFEVAETYLVGHGEVLEIINDSLRQIDDNR